VETTAYLSLGSNLGDRSGNLQQAIERLRTLGNVQAVSSFYETEPVGFTDQPWFINCAVELITSLSADQLLAHSLEIEAQLGRLRTQPQGPRTIDIDILLFGSSVIDNAELTVPHPGMQERRFVLEPVAEIAPKLRHPVLGQTIEEMRDTLPPGAPVVRWFSEYGESGQNGR
jgi:2-amino-4-hydroxy-6-hydroxymethyldihydropteridine diphosphokinase